MAFGVRWRITALLGVFAVWGSALHAQATGRVSGRVIDSTSQNGLSNVTVSIGGTQLGALTRVDGGFLITGVPVGPRAVTVRRVGYAAKTVNVTVGPNETAAINVTLSAVAANITGVVVVGYGTQRKEAITGAVATVDPEKANVGVITNASQLLQGRVAGVQIQGNSGDPGANSQIRIRGGSSISGSNDPLYVIDGVPIQNESSQGGGVGIGGGVALARNPLNLLNPSDIANITVLKDAAATAIYGSRGANGVVLIETKKGKAGTSQFDYETFVSTASRARSIDFATGDQYRAFVERMITQGTLPATRRADLGTANTDWEDEIARTGYTNNHVISFSGGSANTQYRASLNAFDQQGIILANGLARYQGRLNANHSALDGKLRLGLNLTTSRLKDRFLPYENTGGFEGGVFANMAIYNPTRPVLDATASSGFYELGRGAQGQRNPVALALQTYDAGTTTRNLGNVTAQYAILPSLTASTTVGIDVSNFDRGFYGPIASPAFAGVGGRAQVINRRLQNITFQSLATWAPRIGDSGDLEVVGGYEYADFDNNEFGIDAQGFGSDATSYRNIAAASTVIPRSPFSEQSVLASFFGKATYGWKDRYFLNASVRRDGSSRFGEGNKWAVFPAFGASWRLSDESFMQGGPFSNLKLRAGYGIQGNQQAVRPYSSLILLESNNGARYPFGGTPVVGVVPTRNANPNLKWESTAQFNIAAEWGLMANRLSGTVEFYNRNTTDLIQDVAVPQPAPVGSRLENVGSLRNRGVEIVVDYNVWEKANRSWTTGIVAAIERNQVQDLGGQAFINTGGISGQGQSGQQSQRLIPGSPIGTFWGPTFVGYNSTGQQLFRNLTSTGADSGTVTAGGLSANDYGDLGNANPSFTLGWNSNMRFGKLDLSWLARAEFGASVFNNTALVYGAKSNVLTNRGVLASALSAPDTISEPAVFSSRYVESGTFFRLQNVTVGYGFHVPGLAAGDNARVYVSGDNLFLVTDYTGYDPEVFVASGGGARGIDYLTYPRARVFTGGLRFSF
jgi:TonB-dependent starch-binding outer membrane protein SusC